MMNCGIYSITNIVNGHVYIGSACNINKRWSTHIRNLKNNIHCNPHLQSSWNKYGVENFEFSIREQCEKEQLIEREQFYIDSEHPEYNMCPTAGSSLGRITSEATLALMSAAFKGKNNPMFGKQHTEEARALMSITAKGNTRCLGRNLSEETRAQISEAAKGNTRWLGRKHTEEARANMSAAQKGKRKGNTNALGSKRTEEQKRNNSEAQKRVWAERKAQTQPVLEAC